MFDDMTVQELCDAIAKAYYDGDGDGGNEVEHAKTLCMELAERLELTSI